MQHKALVVTDFWATIIAGALSVGMVSAIAFGFGVASRTDVLAAQMDELRKANIPTDIATLKEEVVGIDNRLGNQQKQLDSINLKLDYLISHRPESREESRSERVHQ